MANRSIKSFVLLGGGLALSFVLLAFFWPTADAVGQKNGQWKQRLESNPDNPWYRSQRIEPNRSKDLLARIERGEINLVHELRRLRREYCGGDSLSSACRRKVKEFIVGLEEPAASKLFELYELYCEYEDKMAANPLPMEWSLKDKYERIKEIRREVFGAANARLVFGLDEALYDYRHAMHEESQSKSEVSPTERLAEFDRRRRELLGGYHDVIVSQEDHKLRYGLELMVRQNRFTGLSPAQQQVEIDRLREQYFSPSELDEMNEAQRETKTRFGKRRERMQAFLAAERDLLKRYPNLSGAERRARIAALRVLHLGDQPGEF